MPSAGASFRNELLFQELRLHRLSREHTGVVVRSGKLGRLAARPVKQGAFQQLVETLLLGLSYWREDVVNRFGDCGLQFFDNLRACFRQFHQADARVMRGGPAHNQPFGFQRTNGAGHLGFVAGHTVCEFMQSRTSHLGDGQKDDASARPDLGSVK